MGFGQVLLRQHHITHSSFYARQFNQILNGMFIVVFLAGDIITLE
ncbi:hypothetical protein GALL_429820 [mine drainage metagenome]|uniref:Uncharacterized protein n=1 Tax=mine drainage metagenome TaxID=410659 RepID=A0A1J5PUR0_9ZZZZ